MPDNDFGTAIYTNCAPGQGLDGLGGMQFQSRSSGVDREALALIRRNLIYEPPQRLIQEGRPVDAFPPSFAHVYDGVFATAAGVYVGREARGFRQGNHLTHAIVTSNAQPYRSLRPVQLFRAPFWRTEPTESTRSEPLDPAWQPGPFDAGEAGRFVRDQPDGMALLTAILTALLAHLRPVDQAEPRRVLFISERPEPVLLWLTAATLLIPQQEALRLGFKVFTTAPARSTLPVVAVNPYWARSAATVDDDRGYVVFDLFRQRWTAVPEAEEAKHWARLFCEADPYDVCEAAELAAASGEITSIARDLGTAAVLGRTPPASRARPLLQWLKSGPPALREAYGGTLSGTLARLPDLHVLREIDSIADAQFPSLRDQIRLDLLRLELDSAQRNPEEFQPTSPRRPVSADIQPEATRLVTEALQQARGAAFDAVLRVGGRFAVPVPLDPVREAAAAFVSFWADRPWLGYESSAWPSSLPVYDMLRDELSARVPDQPQVADAWWGQLSQWTPDHSDLALPLDRALLSAAMAKSDERTRLRIIRNVLGRTDSAARLPYRELADLLWKRVKPTVEELRTLCRLLPAGTDLGPTPFTGVLARVQGDPTQVPELELCGRLAEARLIDLDNTTTRLLADHRWLEEYESQLTMTSANPDGDNHLAGISQPLLNAHAEALARRLLRISDPMRVKHLLDMLPLSVTIAYLRGCLDRPGSFAPFQIALMFAVRWRAYARLTGSSNSLGIAAYRQVSPGVEQLIGEWYRSASKSKIRDVKKCLTAFGGGLADAWDNYAAEMRRPRLWRDRRESDR